MFKGIYYLYKVLQVLKYVYIYFFIQFSRQLGGDFNINWLRKGIGEVGSLFKVRELSVGGVGFGIF